MEREQLLTQFFERMGVMRRHLMASHSFGRHTKGMPTGAQFGMLATVFREKTLGIKDLAKLFCMTSSAVTQLVNGLVDDKLLTRTVHKDDRRKMHIALTAKGEKLLLQAKKERRLAMEKLLAPLNDVEVRQLHDIQEKVLAQFS